MDGTYRLMYNGKEQKGAGFVEIWHLNKWKAVSAHYWWNNNWGANMVCRQIGYNRGVTIIGTRNPTNKTPFSTEIGMRECSVGSAEIFDCAKKNKFGRWAQKDLAA